jgi:hypothetical protein
VRWYEPRASAATDHTSRRPRTGAGRPGLRRRVRGQCGGRPPATGSLIPHAGPMGPLMVAMIEAAFGARAVPRLRVPDAPAPPSLPARVGAIRMAAITGRANGKQAVTVPANLLTKRCIHGVGARGSDWTHAPIRETTGSDWHGRRSPGRSRGAGVPVRSLTLASRAQPTASTPTPPVDAARPVDAQTRPPVVGTPLRGVPQAPTGITVFILIGNTQTGPSDRQVSRITHFHVRAHTWPLRRIAGRESAVRERTRSLLGAG